MRLVSYRNAVNNVFSVSQSVSVSKGFYDTPYQFGGVNCVVLFFMVMTADRLGEQNDSFAWGKAVFCVRY